MLVVAELPFWQSGPAGKEGDAACRRGVAWRARRSVRGVGEASNGDYQTHLARFDPEPLRLRDSSSSHAIRFI